MDAESYLFWALKRAPEGFSQGSIRDGRVRLKRDVEEKRRILVFFERRRGPLGACLGEEFETAELGLRRASKRSAEGQRCYERRRGARGQLKWLFRR